MPLLPIKEIESFLFEVAPYFSQSIKADITLLPGKARIGYLFPTAIFFAILSAGAGCFFVWGWFGLLLSGLSILLGIWRFKDGGWRITGNMLLLRFRLFSRITILVPKGRIQFYDILRNPWQLRKGLSTPRVSVASGTKGAQFRLRGLQLEQSYSILEWLNKP